MDNYPILIDEHSLAAAGAVLRAYGFQSRAAIITDSNVAVLYAGILQESLSSSGYASELFVIPDGEASKTLETVTQLYDGLVSKNFSKADFVICLGGGVVGDVGGFTAATYLRGLPLIHIPTSLIAQADSSVGSKCGVNLPAGKNLAGAFYNPSLVLTDTSLLATLPEAEAACGMAEVIKYALIALPQLWQELERGSSLPLTSAISYCLTVKTELVRQDPSDRGARRILNFGHTLGHCYEKLGGYDKIPHGTAVAAGMLHALAIGEEMGLTERGLSEKLALVLDKYPLPGLNIAKRYVAHADLARCLLRDKKCVDGAIEMIFVTRPGEAVRQYLSVSEIVKYCAGYAP